MTGIRAVVFDLFGTLIHPWPNAAADELTLMLAEACGTDPGALRKAWSGAFDTRMTASLEHTLKLVCERLAIAAPSAELTAPAWRRRLAHARAALETPRPDAVPTLRVLRHAGLATALISDCSEDVPLQWETSPLAPHIDVPLFSCSEGVKKPDPRIYARACERLGVPPAECLYVGDGDSTELQGATAVGMRAVQIRPGDTFVYPWEGEVIASLSEVPGLVRPSA